MEAGPLQHEFHGQFGPWLAAVPRDEDQVRKVVHDLVDELNVLAGCFQPRAWYPGTTEDRYAKFDAFGVDRIHLLVVDWDLGECSRGKHADGPGSEGLMLADQATDPCHTFIWAGSRRRDEPIGESLHRIGPRTGRVADADQTFLDAPQVHLTHRHGDRVVPVLHSLLGNVFEHVLNREV